MFFFDDDEPDDFVPKPKWALFLAVLVAATIILLALAGCSAQGSHSANLDFHFLDGGGRRR